MVTAKQLAYGMVKTGSSSPQLYRIQRSFPRVRFGKTIVTTPQFKANVIYTTSQTLAPSGFGVSTSITPAAVRWPSGPKVL